MSAAVTGETATRADIVELQGAIRSLEERFKGEIKLLRWMIGAALPILVGIGIQDIVHVGTSRTLRSPQTPIPATHPDTLRVRFLTSTN